MKRSGANKARCLQKRGKSTLGIAEAILRGNPTKAYPHIRKIVGESGGTMIAVSENEIRFAQQCVADDEGITICPSAATAVASVLKMALRNPAINSETIVINLSGGLREEKGSAKVDTWLNRNENGWQSLEVK